MNNLTKARLFFWGAFVFGFVLLPLFLFTAFSNWAWLIWGVLIIIFIIFSGLPFKIWLAREFMKGGTLKSPIIRGEDYGDDLMLTFSIPYGEKFSGKVVIIRSVYGCLSLYNEEEWKRLEKLRSSRKRINNPEERVIHSIITNGAKRTQMGENGNLIIPFYLKQYAKIKNEVIFIESGNRLDIWAKEEFKKYKNKAQNNKQQDDVYA